MGAFAKARRNALEHKAELERREIEKQNAKAAKGFRRSGHHYKHVRQAEKRLAKLEAKLATTATESKE